MKKYIATTLLLFIVLSAYGQHAENSFKKWQLGLSIEPVYSYRKLNLNSSEEWIEALRDSEEIPALGYRLGLAARKEINSRWSTDVALQFGTSGYTTKKEDLEWITEDDNLPKAARTRFAYRFLSIPVKANYHFKLGGIGAYVSAGASFDYFFNKRITVRSYYADGTRTKTVSSNNFGYENTCSVIFGMGMNLPINKRLWLSVEPNFRGNIVTITKREIGREYLYSFGINSTLLIKFRRKDYEKSAGAHN